MSEPAGDDAALSAELAALAPLLDRISARAPTPALVEQTLRLAAVELARAPSLLPGVAAVRAPLPAGFGPELARLLATALPALALALVVAQGIAALTALGLVTASLPLFAHRRALLRTRGANG